ncbi:hypothetical protein B4099_2207 [Heyndrickxia coagulans]|uniref:Uncharacterized protein n=1 Tax=Heyndrickxia coagulans TaxID=1398 RepID=A0A150JXA8_HEYCO|nr:hypothetical protein B4099_2207 [Heyndrickxia coagulans]
MQERLWASPEKGLQDGQKREEMGWNSQRNNLRPISKG